jgi:hypothetical protein
MEDRGPLALLKDKEINGKGKAKSKSVRTFEVEKFQKKDDRDRSGGVGKRGELVLV